MTSFQWLKLSDKKRSHLFVNPPDNKWYDNTITSKVVATSSSFKLNELNMIQDIAKKEFQKEEDIYLKRRRKTGESDVDEKWIRDVAQSGTLSDKVAALALIIQESPIHNLQSFDTLLSYCSHKKEQRSCQLAMEAVKDLLIHNVLPDRKLNSFQFYCNSGYFHHSDMNMSILLTFWYEDQLITRIKSFIDNIEEIGLKSSNIEYFKKFCMEIVCDLLISKPEQEARLLNMLTNKLGDPMKGIIPKCIELLDKIISIHPVMKGVIVREVRQFLYRPHLPPRSLYAATNFLTSIRLTKKDMKAAVSTTSSPASSVTSTTDVASQLVECYISLFEKSTIENNGSESSSSSKLLSSLLQGVNRVYPFLKNKQSLIKHVDTLFKITHTTQFATAVQALTLISHIALPTPTRARSSTTSHDATIAHDNATVAIDKDDGGGSTDTDDAGIVTRYYRALYSMLFSEQILSRTRNTLFFKLLFRSLKFDPSMERKLAFMKRLTILLLQCNSAIAAGILLLLSEACSNMSAAAGNRGHSDAKSAVKDTTIKTSSSRQGQSNLHSKKQNDDDKRLSFFSLDKLFDFPAYTETAVVLVDDQEHDWFDCYDARKREPLFAFYTEKEKDVTSNSMPIGNGNISSSSKSNLLHRNHMTMTGSHAAAKTLPTLWETALLKRHFHPSVQAFMNGFSASPHTIDFSGDPISDFSITAFLNRFAYKNPKKSRDKDTSSSSTSLSNKTKFSTGEEPINRILDPTHTSSVGDNEEEESSSKLTSDKLFFYKYFTEREKLRSEGKVRNRSKNKKSSRADGDGDDEIDEDDEEEAIDMFADKLADDLMKNHAKSIDPDDDDDDDEGDYESDEDLYQDQNSFSDVDDDDDDDEDDDESDNGMDLDDFARKKSTKREANTSKSQLKSGNQGSSSKDDDEDSDDDEDDDDGYNLAVYDSDEEVHHQKSKTNKQLSSKSSAANDTNNGKSKKRSKDTGSDDMSDFAAAEDYEKVIDQLMQKRFGDSYNNQTSNDIENRTQSIKTQVEVSKPKRRRQN